MRGMKYRFAKERWTSFRDCSRIEMRSRLLLLLVSKVNEVCFLFPIQTQTAVSKHISGWLRVKEWSDGWMGWNFKCVSWWEPVRMISQILLVALSMQWIRLWNLSRIVNEKRPAMAHFSRARLFEGLHWTKACFSTFSINDISTFSYRLFQSNNCIPFPF